MFKFGFSNDGSDNETEIAEKPMEWLESTEIDPETVPKKRYNTINVINCGKFTIKHVSDKEVVDDLSELGETILSAENNHSDLITAVYEGGLKVWECTFDLLTYINENGLNLNEKNVLDLGCGAGFVGILASLKGARTCFQDYNSEVLKAVTIPNVVLNGIVKCKFYSGDWQSFCDLLSESHKFDYIFTSETIYNTNNYPKLLNIFSKLLKDDGQIYLAAKYYYFGVGGGVRQFEDILKQSKIFNYATCWTCSQGVKRIILKISLK